MAIQELQRIARTNKALQKATPADYRLPKEMRELLEQLNQVVA